MNLIVPCLYNVHLERVSVVPALCVQPIRQVVLTCSKIVPRFPRAKLVFGQPQMREVHVRNLGLHVSCIERAVPSVECCDSFDRGVWQYFLQTGYHSRTSGV